jgi:hypothetical protein
VKRHFHRRSSFLSTTRNSAPRLLQVNHGAGCSAVWKFYFVCLALAAYAAPYADPETRGTTPNCYAFQTEVMQFVADVWQIRSLRNLAKGLRGWVNVNNEKGVTMRFVIRIQSSDIGVAFQPAPPSPACCRDKLADRSSIGFRGDDYELAGM